MFLKLIYKFSFTNTVFNEDNKIKRLCVNLKARNLMSIIKKYYIASTSRMLMIIGTLWPHFQTCPILWQYYLNISMLILFLYIKLHALRIHKNNDKFTDTLNFSRGSTPALDPRMECVNFEWPLFNTRELLNVIKYRVMCKKYILNIVY